MTQERRSDCLAHTSLEATLGSMNEKIDLILERQLEYSNRITKLETKAIADAHYAAFLAAKLTDTKEVIIASAE